MSQLWPTRRGQILQLLRNDHRVGLPVLRHRGQTRDGRVPRVRHVPHGPGGAQTMEHANDCAVGRHRRRDGRPGRCSGVLDGSGQSCGGTGVPSTVLDLCGFSARSARAFKHDTTAGGGSIVQPGHGSQ